MMAVARVIHLIGVMLLALGCTELPVESDQGLTADASSDKVTASMLRIVFLIV